MSTIDTNEQLSAYLDKVSRLYPGGIPRAVIQAKQTEVKRQPRCALLYAGLGDALDEQLAALAEAICVKGLRVAIDQCVVRAAGATTLTSEDLAQVVREAGAQVVILCGSSLQPGSVSEVEGTLVLATFGLNRIAQDIETKRRFWEHLKLVIPRLHGAGGA